MRCLTYLVLFLLPFSLRSQVYEEMKMLDPDSIRQVLPSLEGRDRIDALNQLALALSCSGPGNSIAVAAVAKAEAEKLGYPKGIANANLYAGNAFFYLDSIRPATLHYLEALRIYEDLEPCRQMGFALLMMQGLNMDNERYEKSLEYGRRAASVFEELSEEWYYFLSLMKIGSAFNSMGKMDTAILVFDSVLNRLKEKHYPELEVSAYQTCGYTWERKYDRTRNKDFLVRALDLYYKKLNLEIAEGLSGQAKALTLISLGEAYHNLDPDKYSDSAVKYTRAALQLTEDHDGSTYINMGCYNVMASMERRKGNVYGAIQMLIQALQTAQERLENFSPENYENTFDVIYQKGNYRTARGEVLDSIYDIYMEIGDFRNALKYYRLKQELVRDVSLQQNRDLVAMLEAESENEKSRSQIATLEREKEINALQVAQSRYYIFGLIAFLLVVVAFGLFFIRLRRIRLEQKAMMREQRLQHDLELKEVESEKLKELDRLRSEFFANISHEFRTPLTLIRGPLEKVLSDIPDDKHRKELATAKKYTGRLQKLINDLLTISKLESGKMQLKATETEMATWLRRYVQSFESLAKQKGIDFRFSSGSKEITAWIDREKFEQVINNLLSNAFKFTEAGGKVEVAVHLPDGQVGSGSGSHGQSQPESDTATATATATNQVRLTISDTGRGISGEELPHIFDRFFQAGHKASNHYEGTGIGLSLTRELVELHHGTIEAESKEGEGATFRILLPAGKEHLKPEEITESIEIRDESLTAEVPVKTYEESPENGPKTEDHSEDALFKESSDQPLLLIVEDNRDMRTYIREYFEKDYEVIEAADGIRGYETAIRKIPDIIISDVMMPRMDGNEFCKRVKSDERTCHIPVILLTARAAQEHKVEGLELGADDFIAKPFDGKELQVRVANLLEQRVRVRKFLETKLRDSGEIISEDLKGSSLTSMDEQFLKKVHAILKEHYRDPEFSPGEMSAKAGLGIVQLNRKIRALTGRTTGEFIRVYRLHCSLEMIRKKSATLAEIAYDVGFSSPAYFSRCFSEHFGKPPSAFSEK